jgi:hypothetical protein
MTKKRKHKVREGRIEKDVDIECASNYASLPRLLPHAGGEEEGDGTTKVARRRDDVEEETPTDHRDDAWSPSAGKKRKKSKKRSRKDAESLLDNGTHNADARKRKKVRGRSGGGPGKQNGTCWSSRSDQKQSLLLLVGWGKINGRSTIRSRRERNVHDPRSVKNL